MSIIESITLFAVILAMAAIPSASVALVVTRSATLGVINGLAVSAGIVLGDLVFIALAIYSLSAVAETLGSLFIVIKMLGGCYLLYLGFSLLTTRTLTIKMAKKSTSKRSLLASFVAGFVLTLGDIKAVIFYASLLPLYVDFSAVETAELITIVLITVSSVGGVKAIYAVFATRLAAYVSNKGLGGNARKAAGSLMLGAGGYLICKA